MVYWFEKYVKLPDGNSNTPPDGAPEGMAPSTVNNTMRQEMAAIEELGEILLKPGAGTGPPHPYDDPITPIPVEVADVYCKAMMDCISPVGTIICWTNPGDASTPNTNAPAGIQWSLCNGQTVGSVTTPDLRNRLIQGANTADPLPTDNTSLNSGNDIDLIDAAEPLWKHDIATEDAGGHTPTIQSNTTGATVDSHQLTEAEMPSHTHIFTGANQNFTRASGNTSTSGGNSAVDGSQIDPAGTNSSTGGDTAHPHGLTDPGHDHTAAAVAAHSHDIANFGPQRQALEFWMRTA